MTSSDTPFDIEALLNIDDPHDRAMFRAHWEAYGRAAVEGRSAFASEEVDDDPHDDERADGAEQRAEGESPDER